MFSSCLSNFGFLVKRCFYYESAGSAQIVITLSSAGSLSAGSLSAGSLSLAAFVPLSV